MNESVIFVIKSIAPVSVIDNRNTIKPRPLHQIGTTNEKKIRLEAIQNENEIRRN